jgi:hypothetical protein
MPGLAQWLASRGTASSDTYEFRLSRARFTSVSICGVTASIDAMMLLASNAPGEPSYQAGEPDLHN